MNGKEHWLQQGNSNALWYDKKYDVWNFGLHEDLGSSHGWLFNSITDTPISSLAATTWWYKANGTWIEDTDEIVLSAGKYYISEIFLINPYLFCTKIQNFMFTNHLCNLPEILVCCPLTFRHRLHCYSPTQIT